jgi:Ran GTPase-activating protein (RanGAP) involved in mRNA processing and transport
MHVRMNKRYYEDLPGDTDEKTAAMLLALQELSGRASLQTLKVSGLHLHGGEAILADVVRAQSSALTRVDASHNDFDRRLGPSLAAALGSCLALSALDLSFCDICSEMPAEFLPQLSRCTQLAHLNLQGNVLLATGTRALAEWVAKFPLLATLNVSECGLDSDGAIRLAEALPLCPALAVLDLSANSISAPGAVRLAKALPLCAALTDLDLSDNSIGDDGCESLLDMREAGQKLALRINVSRNGVGVANIVKAMAAGMVSYTSVRVDVAAAGPATWGNTGATDAALCADEPGRWDTQLRAMRSLLSTCCEENGAA